ncbi:CCA tRNA nucleotidyltransferase [Clostridium sp.]|uniref:CCA tRNA nucleotidyltransferase n=1 Tax=Clostridium sp. TaxID=1506 RepID=UPI002A90F5B9|nr:CCA tRNA nucleotidyltransferase [Clostridium sp.]MDY6011819.1 CCA tRNA nucleotidyltransferase [Clostridium sp.]
MHIKIPDKVKFIIDTFYENNYEAFMVGGCIRDSLLSKEPKDYDIATSALPNITESLFEKTIPTGIKHGTITVLLDKEPFEVTTYRIEGEYKDNRRPDEISFVTNIKDDLSRRDFTINAFAYNSKEGLKDYFNGLEDLQNKIIRTVGDSNKRFNEDALRMMRAIRFASQLDFNIEKSTLDGIKKNKNLLKNISSERIRDELCKLLLSDNSRKGLNLLKDCGVLDVIIPELTSLIGFNHKTKDYNEDLFDHTLSVVENTPNDLILRLSALFHDIGKPKVNDNISEDITRKILTRLHFDNKTIKSVCILIKEYMNVLGNSTDIDIKRFINRTSKENIYSLLEFQKAHVLSLKNSDLDLYELNNMKNKIDNIINSNIPLSIKDLNIDGSILTKELNLKPGKVIGETLNYLLEVVLNNPNLNNETILLEKAKTFIQNKKG